jgi:release factor glutamine methyltransferase
LSTVRQLLAGCSDLDRLDAEVLLSEVLGQGRAWLYAHQEDQASTDQAERFERWVQRRRAGEPVAYLTGWRDFWTFRLAVTPATLIPRPETELLIETALTLLPENEVKRVLDLGTGSGAIALAIASERPLAEVTATDSSAEALSVAKDNARRLGFSRLTFVHGDWYQAVQEQRFDLILSNPPYIAASDPHLDQDDVAHEPRSALTPASDHLNPGGYLLVEHGHDQRDALLQIVEDAGLEPSAMLDDLAGLPRVMVARYVG